MKLRLAALILIGAGSLAWGGRLSMTLAEQTGDPVRLTKVTFGLKSAMERAEFQNRSGRPIQAYRIGWANVHSGHTEFHKGPWMNVPAGIAPGATEVVPNQMIPLDQGAQQMVFFVAEVRYEGGTLWTSHHHNLIRAT